MYLRQEGHLDTSPPTCTHQHRSRATPFEYVASLANLTIQDYQQERGLWDRRLCSVTLPPESSSFIYTKSVSNGAGAVLDTRPCHAPTYICMYVYPPVTLSCELGHQ